MIPVIIQIFTDPQCAVLDEAQARLAGHSEIDVQEAQGP